MEESNAVIPCSTATGSSGECKGSSFKSDSCFAYTQSIPTSAEHNTYYGINSDISSTDPTAPLIQTDNFSKSAPLKSDTSDGISTDPEISHKNYPKWLSILKSFSLEIYLFLYITGYAVSDVISQDLLLTKACLYDFKFSDTICNHLDDHSDLKTQVLQKATSFNVYSKLSYMIPASIVSMFVGSWSDVYGHRVPLIVVAYGEMFSSLGGLFTSVYLSLPLYVNVSSRLPGGLCGGFICALASVFNGGTSESSYESRTKRFFYLGFAIASSFSLGSVFGGFLKQKFSYSTVYLVGIALLTMAITVAIFLIESRQSVSSRDGLSRKIKYLFNLNGLRKCLRACIRQRENRSIRRQILLIFLSVGVTVTNYTATTSIAYYYARQRYSWSVTMYTQVTFIASLTSMLFIVFAIFTFTRIKIKDPYVALIGCVSMMSQSILRGLASAPWIYYLSAAVGVAADLSFTGMRSHISKLVNSDEVGKVFSIMATCESVVPVAGDIFNGAIFNWSITFFPGLVYVAIGGLMIIPCATMIYCGKLVPFTRGPGPLKNEHLDGI